MERDIKKFLVILFSLFAFLSCAAPFGVYHRVKKNETLYSIAKLYGTTVDNLEKNNNIPDAKKISVGDYIFVPGVAAPLDTNGNAAVAHSNAKKETPKDAGVQKQTGKSAGKSSQKADSNPPSSAKPSKPGQYIWPVKGVITSKFGNRWGKKHSGIDISCPQGTPVVAAAAGTVLFSGEKSGYGLTIIIKHPDNSFTIYAHNSKNLVSEQKQVKQGEKIALSGQTGRSTGPHLHFEIRKGSEPVDPLEILPKTVP